MKWFTLAVCLFLLGTYSGWRWVFRHTTAEVIAAVQVHGPTLRVLVSESRRLSFGSGHWSYGGGDYRHALKFELRGNEVIWRGKAYEEPCALQRLGDGAIVISQENPFSVSGSENLMLYRYIEGKWSQLARDGIPPELAICNLSPFGPRWKTATIVRDGHEIRLHNEGRVQALLDKKFIGGGPTDRQLETANSAPASPSPSPASSMKTPTQQ